MNNIRVLLGGHSWKDVVVVQSLNHIQLFATPWTVAWQASLSSTVSWSLLRFMSIESVMPPTISSSVAPSSCLQSFPVSWLFESRGQSMGASASASVLPVNSQGWIPLGLTGWTWRRVWQPTSVFLLGESHGQRSLAGYSPQRARQATVHRVTKSQA